MPNLTIAEWAKTVGISRQQGYAAVTRCAIPVVDGQVDQEYATYKYNTLTRKRANAQRPDSLAGGATSAGAAGPGGAGGAEPKEKVPGYDASRARREAAEAALAEMKQAEVAGRFVVKEEVDSAVFEISRALRDGLMNCARRIAADVAALSTAEECEAVIEREHRLLLSSMAHAFSSQLKVAVEGTAE